MVNIKTDGTKQTSITEWGIEPELRYFTLTQGTAQPWVKTWYDARGRKVRTESRGEGNVSVYEIPTYNKKGEVTSRVSINGDLTTSESYTYDDRVTHSLSTGKSTSNASDKVYYPCTDHLGSIIKLVDANGTESFKATYDAWGQQTVTTNTLNFHRGYTGHEHLSQFSLINMNGRMYDPLLGRFLSPDPFVQLPDFSQNFNRYSYCLNNPLVYVDPDGEIIWVIAGAAIIGGVWNTVNNWDAICEGGFGTFVKYFGVGALAGGLGAATGVGTAALLGTSTGFAAGAIIGAASGGAGGFALGGGNALAAGGGWSKFWNGASAGFTTGLVNGAALGGITGGLDALSNGKNFWSGENIASGRSAFSFNNEPIPTATQHKATATKPDAIPLKPNPNKGLSPSAELPTRMTSDNIEYTIRTNYNPTPNIEGRGSLIPRPEIRGYDSRLNIQTDSYHNFPSSFDKLIIQEGSGYMPHGNSSMFYARGVINGIEGVYTIGINNQTGVIYHRCFYEWNTFIKNFSPYK